MSPLYPHAQPPPAPQACALVAAPRLSPSSASLALLFSVTLSQRLVDFLWPSCSSCAGVGASGQAGLFWVEGLWRPMADSA